MPIFELQGPDGKTYEVDAPDMGAAANAFGEMAGPSVGDLSVRNVATAAARGVPILGGLVDEAIAGGQALAGNGSYAENLKAEQDRQAAAAAAPPPSAAPGVPDAQGWVTLPNGVRVRQKGP